MVKRKMNHKMSNRIFDSINLIVMIFVLLIFLYPMWFIIIASVSNPNYVLQGQVVLFPKGFTLEGYKYILEYKDIWTGYMNSILLVVFGVPLTLIVTIMFAYTLSRKEFKARKICTGILMVTMFFNGGMIPTYLLMRDLNLLDTRWSLILPGLISVYNVIVARTFFQNSIPEGIVEAARMDGCSDFIFFVKIVLPLSKPIIAVIALFETVTKWNIYFQPTIYISNRKLMPLQVILQEILVGSQLSPDMIAGFSPSEYEILMQITNIMKYSVIIVATVPLLLIYPLVQKHFVKGIMVGAVKG